MNCELILSRMDGYIDSELDPQAKDEVKNHLSTCSNCRAEYDARTSVKQRVRLAVQAQEVDPALQFRIRAALREQPSRRPWYSWSPRLVAAAAMLAVCVGGVGVAYQSGYLRPTKESQQAFVEQVVSRVPGLMKVGLGDHVHCTVYRKLPNDAPALDALAKNMGPKFSGLLPILQAKTAGQYQIMMAHQCGYQGRRFTHIALQGESRLISLVIARKGDGESFTRENLAAALQNSGLPIYRAGVSRFEIAGFESKDYLAYIVSDLPQDRNLLLTASLAPEVRDFLNGV